MLRWNSHKCPLTCTNAVLNAYAGLTLKFFYFAGVELPDFINRSGSALLSLLKAGIARRFYDIALIKLRRKSFHSSHNRFVILVLPPSRIYTSILSSRNQSIPVVMGSILAIVYMYVGCFLIPSRVTLTTG